MRIGFMMRNDPERIRFAKNNGFKSLELMVSPNDDFWPGSPDWEAKARDVAETCKVEGLRISCLASFYVNHLDGPDVEKNAQLVRDAIALAKVMHVGVVAGFAGKKMDAPLEDSLPLYKEVWREHSKLAADNGIKIAFEHCPMGPYHQPPGGNNCMCTPQMWEAGFNAIPGDAIGLEWDPSHLVCMFIDPVESIRRFGSRIYHVHAKDAKVHKDLLARDGVWSRGAIEHCFPGLGDTDWAACVKELLRQGYTSDMNIEGWHDGVYRNFDDGPRREDEGLIISLRWLEQFVVQD